MTHPLCSFLMITYNQEKYIAKALESAFSQTVPELEIVVCDDGSSDHTFEIATEIAKRYTGPFSLILHRNDHNIGIGPNFQLARSLAHGEWLFMAAGDDISLPMRCQLVMEAMARYPHAGAFCSNYQIIDENDHIHGYYSHDFLIAPGAVFCWHKDIFDCFPPLDASLRVEDFPLLTRVFALNRDIVKLPQSTLLYRIDGHSFTGQGRSNALEVKRYQLRLSGIQRICTERRIADILYRSDEGYNCKDAEALIARQKRILMSMDDDKENFEQSVKALEGSWMQKMKYLFTPSRLYLHRSFSLRLRVVLAGIPMLRKLKQKLHPCRASLPAFTLQHLQQSLPENLSPVIVSTAYYLNTMRADFYIPLDSAAHPLVK